MTVTALKSRHVKVLPAELVGILDFEELSERTGVEATSLRRTAASFVRFARAEAMPARPRETLRFVSVLLELLAGDVLAAAQQRATERAAFAKIVDNFKRFAAEQGLELPSRGQSA